MRGKFGIVAAWSIDRLGPCLQDLLNTAVRLQLRALAYNLNNFLRTPAMPEPIVVADQPEGEADQGRPKIVSHGRCVTSRFQGSCSPRLCG
jgi:hypothetical protein